MLLQVGSRPIRPLSSVILPRNQIDAIVDDAEQFQGSEAWYGALLEQTSNHTWCAMTNAQRPAMVGESYGALMAVHSVCQIAQDFGVS